MSILYQVGELIEPQPERFAVIKIDTDVPVEPGGVKGVIISLHMDRDEAKAAALRLGGKLQ